MLEKLKKIFSSQMPGSNFGKIVFLIYNFLMHFWDLALQNKKI